MKNGRIPQTWSHVNRYEGMTNTIVQLRIPFCSGSMVEASCAIISDRNVGQRIVGRILRSRDYKWIGIG